MTKAVTWGDVRVQFVFHHDGSESVLLDNGDRLNLYFCDLDPRDWYQASLGRADGTFVQGANDFDPQEAVSNLWKKVSTLDGD